MTQNAAMISDAKEAAQAHLPDIQLVLDAAHAEGMEPLAVCCLLAGRDSGGQPKTQYGMNRIP